MKKSTLFSFVILGVIFLMASCSNEKCDHCKKDGKDSAQTTTPAH